MELTQSILLVSSIIFGSASILFLFLAGSKKKPAYSYAFIVSIITLLSSLVMFDGSLVTFASSNEPLYYTRWIGYIASCSLLMISIAKYLGVSKVYFDRLVYTTGITMLAGALASASDGLMMLIYFIIGSLSYLLMLGIIVGKGSKNLGWIGKYIWLGWTIFPVVFILSPEGYGIITLTTSMIAYLLLDVFTKIIFYLELGGKRS